MLRHYCKRGRVAAALVVALLLTGCGAPDQDEMAASPGQADFNNHCAGCHGRLGQGRPPAFPPLDGSEWLELPPEALTSIILLGLRGDIEVAGKKYVGYMPPMTRLDDERVARIVNFVNDSWGASASGWRADDVAAVRAAVSGQRAIRGREGLDKLLEELP